MRICKLLAVAGCCCLLLSGCTERNYVNPNSKDYEYGPDFNIYDDYELDEEQVLEDVLDVGLDPVNYPMAAGIDFGLHMDEGHIDVAAIVKDGTSMKDALYYGSEALKVVNDQVASQDFSYEMSSDTSYGGIYENNDAQLDIYYASDFENDEAPFMTFTIPAGKYMVLDLDDME